MSTGQLGDFASAHFESGTKMEWLKVKKTHRGHMAGFWAENEATDKKNF